VVVCGPQDGEVLLLEGIGALTWHLLGNAADEADLARALSEHSGADAANVHEQLAALLADLAQHGLASRT
jgi:hypothetical protein